MMEAVNRLVSSPGYPRRVLLLQIAMALGPIAVGVATPLIAALATNLAETHHLDVLANFLDPIKIVGTMCFPFAAYFAARRGWDLARARASATWPTVPGKVRWSRIEKRYAFRGPGYYRLAIAFDFEVAGKKHQGDMVEFGPPNIADKTIIEKLADRYPAGKDVTVHYNPHVPNDAVLETSDEMAVQSVWRVWFFLGMPILAAIVGVIKNS